MLEVQPEWWTVTAGDLLTFLGILAAAVVFVVTLRGDIKVLATRVLALENIAKNISTVLTTLAEQNARLNHHGQRLSRLEDRIDGKDGH